MNYEREGKIGCRQELKRNKGGKLTQNLDPETAEKDTNI